jgi:hypothetical protein
MTKVSQASGQGGPPSRRGDEAKSPTLPLPPPRNRAELDGFLESLSQIPVDQVEGIREMFAAFTEPDYVAHLFHEALAERPVGDLGRFMLLLSALGQLARPSSLQLLHDLVWADDKQLMGGAIYDGPIGDPAPCCVFPSAGLIQSRAVEMFAWIARGSEDDALLRVVSTHPSVATRLAAADAFLFAHGDEASARERVWQASNAGDRSSIGVPRLTRGCDREAFERAMEERHQHQKVALPTQAGVQRRRANGLS